MGSYFYIEGYDDASKNEAAVITACESFLKRTNFKNECRVVHQTTAEGTDVGLNLEGNGNDGFVEDAVRILTYVQSLADELRVTFVAGTDGEDRIWIDPETPIDIKQCAEFLNVP